MALSVQILVCFDFAASIIAISCLELFSWIDCQFDKKQKLLSNFYTFPEIRYIQNLVVVFFVCPASWAIVMLVGPSTRMVEVDNVFTFMIISFLSWRWSCR